MGLAEWGGTLKVDVQEGRVVEQGQHSELLEQQGLYAQMWNQQEFGSNAALDTRGEGSEGALPADSADS